MGLLNIRKNYLEISSPSTTSHPKTRWTSASRRFQRFSNCKAEDNCSSVAPMDLAAFTRSCHRSRYRWKHQPADMFHMNWRMWYNRRIFNECNKCKDVQSILLSFYIVNFPVASYVDSLSFSVSMPCGCRHFEVLQTWLIPFAILAVTLGWSSTLAFQPKWVKRSKEHHLSPW